MNGNIEKYEGLRNDIRKLLDKLEAAKYDKKPLTLTSKQCGKAAMLLRRIQDAGAVVLGYEAFPIARSQPTTKEASRRS